MSPFSLHPPARKVQDLSERDITQLSQILSVTVTHFPWDSATETLDTRRRQSSIAQQISNLPRHLRSPAPLQGKVVGVLSRSTQFAETHGPSPVTSLLRSITQKRLSHPPRSPLCKTHAGLNAQLIRDLASHLEVEVSLNLTNLAVSWPNLSLEHQTIIQQLRALIALWTPDSDLRHSFLVMPTRQWTFQSDRCDACMLARVGAHKPTVEALLVALLSRRKHNMPRAPLIPWTRGWFSGHRASPREFAEVHLHARDLLHARRQAQKARRENGNAVGIGIQYRPDADDHVDDENILTYNDNIDNGDDENKHRDTFDSQYDDFEASILNAYGNPSRRTSSRYSKDELGNRPLPPPPLPAVHRTHSNRYVEDSAHAPLLRSNLAEHESAYVPARAGWGAQRRDDSRRRTQPWQQQQQQREQEQQQQYRPSGQYETIREVVGRDDESRRTRWTDFLLDS
ncbi:MAG: hypothetical protein M1825_002447 [Sarcosagium campestre]|nr:MAG: hypothetical protein M1825_002447 [Sarcosagium campestre]